MGRAATFLPPKPGKTDLLIKPKRPETVEQATVGLKAGPRAGFLGNGNIIRKPDYEVRENLSPAERQQKKLLQQFLGRIIEPTSLSSKSNPAMDRQALVNKLSRSTLDDLLHMVPERIKGMTPVDLEAAILGNTITEEELAEIQNLYMDRSP